METVFLLSIGLIIYTYFGYPVLTYILARLFRRNIYTSPISPFITIVIAAYNEERNIAEKLENTLAINYPQDRFEIIVVSDGSSDSTCTICKTYPSVKLVELKERHGKEYAQAEGVKLAKGEVLIFTDAGIRLDSESIKNIIRNFSDQSVGCVTSEDKVIGADGNISRESPYIRYDTWIRRNESSFNSVVGMSGSFFASRAILCQNLYSNPPVDSDFRVVMNCQDMKLRAINDSNVFGYYRDVSIKQNEFQRKVRTILRGLVGMSAQARYLNPFKYKIFSLQLFSHKVLRWLSPLLLLSAFTSNIYIFSVNELYALALLLQLTLYVFAIIGLISPTRIQGGLLTRVPAFFLYANITTAVALIQFFAGKRIVFWNSSNRS